MIKIADLQDLIIDLAHEELVILSRPYFINQDFVLFNFTKHNQVKIYTKIVRDMPLTEQERELKAKPELLGLLERSTRRLIADLKLPIYDHLKYFNFHDCLAAFVKQVF